MITHTRVRIVGGKVEVAPLKYSAYPKANGWTDVRVAEIKSNGLTRSELVYKAGGTVESIAKDVKAKNPAASIVGINAAFVSGSTLLGKTIINGKVVFPDVTGVTEKRPHLYCRAGKIGIGRVDDPDNISWAVCGMTMIRAGKYVFPVAAENVRSDVTDGIRARTAAGIKADGSLVIVLVDDGPYDTGLSQTNVGTYLLSLGCVDAVVLDGGGSSTVWTSDDNETHVCEIGNKPRVVSHMLAFYLAESVETQPTAPALKEPHIIEDFIQKGRKNRPGTNMKPKYASIHDTANPAARADAVAHAAYLQTTTAASKPVSWTFTVDDIRIVQHLPLDETGYHAGDGANGPGNLTSIGIEICENPDGDRTKAETNAAWLVAKLIREGIIEGIEFTVQHNRWSGKNCPAVIRARKGGWDGFIAQVKAHLAKPAASNEIAIFVNGKELTVRGEVKSGVTYAPVRAVAEAFGAKVTWDKAGNRVLIDK